MAAHRNRHAQSLAKQSAELALAVPQVIAHRMTRMALSGPTLSERDRKEFHLMGAEKVAAFAEAWQAMALQTMRANQAMATTMMQSLWTPWKMMSVSPWHAATQVQTAALGVLSKGMTPVHRTASANARRLAKTKLR